MLDHSHNPHPKHQHLSLILSLVGVLIAIIALLANYESLVHVEKLSEQNSIKKEYLQGLEKRSSIVKSGLRRLKFANEELLYVCSIPTSKLAAKKDILSSLNKKRGEETNALINDFDGIRYKRVYGEELYNEVICISQWNWALYLKAAYQQAACVDPSSLAKMQLNSCEKGRQTYKNFCYTPLDPTKSIEMQIDSWFDCISIKIDEFLINKGIHLTKYHHPIKFQKT